MSERAPGLEHYEQNTPEKKDLQKQQERLREHHEKAAEEAERDKPSIEKIRESIEKAAQSKDKVNVKQQEARASESPLSLNTQFKGHIANQTLKRVQKQLPARDRAFSKVIHQPAVEAISNAAEKTVARPSGLLFAGLFSLVSSIAILYICRHYGYEYNFLVGLAGLGAGFMIGLLLEAAWNLGRKLSRH